MTESGSWNYIYKTTSSKGKEVIAVRGVVGRSRLASFLKDLPVEKRALNAFNQSWDTTRRVIDQGGVLTSAGLLLADDIDQVKIPVYARQSDCLPVDRVLKFHGYDLQKADTVRQILGKPHTLGFDVAGIRSQQTVYFLPKIGRDLAYVLGSEGACSVFLIEDHNGKQSLDDKPLVELERPFSAFIRGIYNQLEVANAERIAPSAIFRECLVEASEQVGKGRLQQPV